MISDSIPIELILEILLRLPSKSTARFHCMSKQWASVLRGPYFTELFLTRSSARPRLLFAINKRDVWSIFSLPQHLSPYEKSLSSSSLVVTAEFHMKFPPDNIRNYPRTCGYASGLICFESMWMNFMDESYYGVPVICNPITGRYAALPYLQSNKRGDSFFGFDPIDKQYKVLYMANYISSIDRHKILTLGTEKMRWRRIKCSLRHEIVSEGICINGVLYYVGEMLGEMSESMVIVCFDVRSEKFKFIYPFISPGSFCQLINYKGKLGAIHYDHGYDDDAIEYAIEYRVWVLEDAEKQEWSKYAYTMRDDIFLDKYNHVVGIGVTVTGEIVFSMYYFTSEKPFYVFYFNPERNTLQRVEIQGFGGYHEEGQNNSRVYVFVDHVEDLNVNDPKLLKSNIYDAPYPKIEESESSSSEEEESEEIEKLTIRRVDKVQVRNEDGALGQHQVLNNSLRDKPTSKQPPHQIKLSNRFDALLDSRHSFFILFFLILSIYFYYLIL